MLCVTVPLGGALRFKDLASGAEATIDGTAIPREPEGRREVYVALRRAATVWRVQKKAKKKGGWRRVMVDVAPGFSVTRPDRRPERKSA